MATRDIIGQADFGPPAGTASAEEAFLKNVAGFVNTHRNIQAQKAQAAREAEETAFERGITERETGAREVTAAARAATAATGAAAERRRGAEAAQPDEREARDTLVEQAKNMIGDIDSGIIGKRDPMLGWQEETADFTDPNIEGKFHHYYMDLRRQARRYPELERLAEEAYRILDQQREDAIKKDTAFREAVKRAFVDDSDSYNRVIGVPDEVVNNAIERAGFWEVYQDMKRRGYYHGD